MAERIWDQVLFACFLGLLAMTFGGFVGYGITKSVMETAAIRAGVAQYEWNVETGCREFVYVKPNK